MSEPLRIICPDCQTLLIIDRNTGAILEHKSAETQKKLTTLEEAAQENVRRHERAKDVFAASVEREKNKSDILEKTFQDALSGRKRTL